MIIYPAIDLIGGAAVRLLRGDYSKKTEYSSDPVSVALSFRERGARFLHLVDLDGAKTGSDVNFKTIEAIIRSCGMAVEIGGGIRDERTIEKYLDAGAHRVIIGTRAAEDPDWLASMVEKFTADRIAVGADCRDGRVMTRGWLDDSGATVDEFFLRMGSLGVKDVIVTDISKDGAMSGPNTELYRHLAALGSPTVGASGGVTTLSDVEALLKTGCVSAIIGKALYENTVDLAEAIKTAEGRQC